MSKPVQQKTGKVAPVAKPASSASAITPQGGLIMAPIKIFMVVLAAVSFLLYANTLGHGFVLDDIIMVKDNTIVAKGFQGIGELLTTPHMRGYLVVPNDTYRPLSLVMFAIETGLFGQNAHVNHFFNVLTFVGCVLLFFWFLHLFFDEKKPVVAFIGALIFAVHPIHTEVVANIKSRDELLCFLFAFWALILFLKFMKQGKMMHLVLGSIILYLSIISKENTVVFMGVVPVLFFLFKNDDSGRAIKITLAAIIPIVLFIIVRNRVLTAYDANTSGSIEFIDNALVQAPDVMTRIATSIYISGKYLWMMFVPYPLVCNYSYNAIPFVGFGNPVVLATMAAYGFIVYYSINAIRKKEKNPFAFAVLFFLMTIALFNNMFILIGAEMGERFLFMASAGACLAIATAFDKWLLPNLEDIYLSKRFTMQPKVLALLVPVALVYSVMTFARNKDWRDNVELYKVDLEKSPNDARLNYYLGTALAETVYMEEQDPAKRSAIDVEAIGHLRSSLAIYSKFSEANAELGRIFDREKKYDSAEYYDRKALEINPGHATATNNLGSVYLASGKYPQALELFRKALTMSFDPRLAYFNMGKAYNQLKMYDSAITCYRYVVNASPELLDAVMELGMVYFNKGVYDSAEICFKKIVAANPKDPAPINNLGAIYLNAKMYPKAIEQFKACLAVDANYMSAYSNLGRAYYFSGMYPQAIETFQKEISLNNKIFQNVPYIALSYKKMGKMDEARKWEAEAKRFYSNFSLAAE